jgi:glycosyltransferase involved in cell wall biosynthesis
MRRVRVALVYLDDSLFIDRDRKILGEAFDLRDVHSRGKRAIPRIILGVLRSDVAFCWFALDHAYVACRVAKLAGKRCVVVVGGIDAAKRPDLGYGAHLDPGMSRRTRYTISHADRVLLVDESLRSEITRNTGVERPEIVALPLGFDTEFYAPDAGPKTNVLTVGYVNEANLRRKGLETFVRAARFLPNLPFVLVGADPSPATERLRSEAPANVTLLPGCDEARLREEYRRARVYVQVSSYEGLPNSLAEAMACACVPVGTRVAGIPSLMGETGYYVPPNRPEETARAIQAAYESGRGESARARIAERFGLASRRQAILGLINEFAGRRDGSG